MTTTPLPLPRARRRLALGARASAFGSLLGTDGKTYALASFDASAVLVVVFNSNRCPTAKAYEPRLIELQDRYAKDGVTVVAINSTDAHLYAEESYEAMVEHARESRFNFPYLKDERQEAARRFGAQCTLHAFVLDRERRLRYRGRIDDSRNPAKVTVSDLRNAIDDVLEGREVRVAETTPFGCALDLS
jgi:peroxiredoxin